MRRRTSPRSQRTIELCGSELKFVLRRSKRRTIGLRVDENGLTVSAPLLASHTCVDATLRSQARWVLDKIRVWQARKLPAQAWIEGSELPYLGGRIRLAVRLAAPAAKLIGNTLHVCALDTGDHAVEQRVIEWYRGEARRVYPVPVAHYADRLGVERPRLFISNARSRWGSCNAKGDIRLNWRLMKAAPHVIDYVIAHEIAHLKHMNHGSEFWRTVALLYPSFDEARRELLEFDAWYRRF